MNIIFSRKGYDSSYGGGSSPILPNGDLVSIPIPSSFKDKSGKEPEEQPKEQGVAYEKVNYNGRSYLSLMQELEMKIPERKICHLDPDLLENARSRKPGWKGIFGQQGSAASHLENEGVKEGDLFLFFGSFKRTYKDEQGNLVFEKDYERHIIFGYLWIGEIWRAETILDLKKSSRLNKYVEHPHFTNAELYNQLNTVYIAAESGSQGKKGYGTLQYNDELVLTRNGFSKSRWELPGFFHPKNGAKTMSRHSEKDYRLLNGNTIIQTRGIGQDFVLPANDDIGKWAKNLINTANSYE